MKADRYQVAKNIANIIREHPEKVGQLEKLQAITVHLTSDDGIRVRCELYRNHIVRFRIFGTRSNMTVTGNPLTRDLTRKPYKERPWYVAETIGSASDILRLI